MTAPEMPTSTFAPPRCSTRKAAAAGCPMRYGIYGGFTIANGVTIENARSGSGNDTLIGNEAANRLDRAPATTS